MKQLSLEQIVNCGVDRQTAIAILPQVERWLAALPAVECWQQLTRHILKPDCPFALHELLYETTFSDWDASQKPAPAWFPSQEEIESTNIAALINFNREKSLGIAQLTVGMNPEQGFYLSRRVLRLYILF